MTKLMINHSGHLVPEVRGRKVHITTILFVVMLLVFTACSVVIARGLQRGIIPDEITHITIAKFYTATWGIPEDNPDSYFLGYLGHRPFLYYWINGRIANALTLLMPSASNWHQLLVMRLESVFYSLLTVIFCYLLAKEVIKSRWWQLLPPFFLITTVMFVFLSGGVNYDSLANLFSLGSVYFLVRVVNSKAFVTNSLGWLIFTLAGVLTKITVLPLAAITGLVWLAYVVKNRQTIRFNPIWHWRTAVLLALLLPLIALNFAIYGVNVLQYGSLQPACDRVLTTEQCMQNSFVVRDLAAQQENNLSYRDIFTNAIPDPFEYFMGFWTHAIFVGTIGFVGHHAFDPSPVYPLFVILAVWVGLVAVYNSKKIGTPVLALLVVFLFYAAVLFYTNYSTEIRNGFRHYGIQGRYIFPVIGVIYILAGYFLSSISNPILSRISLAFALFLFTWSSPMVQMVIPAPAVKPHSTILAQKQFGEITGGMEITQDFNAQCKGPIERVELLFATYSRQNTSPVIVRLTDLTNQLVIAEETIPGPEIPGDQFLPIDTPPIPGQGSYRISITSPESVPGNAFAHWRSEEDIFPEGEMYVNGEPTGFDLSFRYICSQPVFAEWFH